MSLLVDTANRDTLHTLLLKLTADTKPLWGKMTPQQMIEHLIENVQYTNGTLIPICRRSPEEALEAKQRGLNPDVQIPKNLFLGDLPAEYAYLNLPASVTRLMADLELFDRYFKTNAMAIHGGFGPMDYNEWIIWHSKHFTHHFRQFGLIEGDI
ncbi:hypothetical protein EWM62_07820 [Mucilaginibacter terrigena]|uniref:DUF1569 domain-containing protein n=1 Tax=Mucilaginibacter terrigena TaxID=2492395 RepID=A0A4Q5LMU3_9SPHI|nr:hypothetical protein [Mucilaginibacter terrigena]RYU90553.1 hypothetical protein EWM62_07820 [Mucilaginibacter terrigena]